MKRKHKGWINRKLLKQEIKQFLKQKVAFEREITYLRKKIVKLDKKISHHEWALEMYK